MSCPPVQQIVEAVERDELSEALQDHIRSCHACADVLTALRDESDGLTICVGSLWVKERITCPHADILLGFVNDGLDPEEKDYIAFHLDTIECPHCQAEVQRLEDLVARGDERRVERAMDDAMRRSAVLLEQLRKR